MLGLNKIKNRSDEEVVCLYSKSKKNIYFQELMRRYNQKLYSYIYRMVNEQKTAEDLYQDTWLKIANAINRGNYQEKGKFSNYLFFVATNRCYDFYRTEKKHKDNVYNEVNSLSDSNKEPFLERLSDYYSNPLKENLSKENMELINKAIDKLPTKQKEVVLLRANGYSFKEISELTSTSINSILSRMRYAQEKIRKELLEYQ